MDGREIKYVTKRTRTESGDIKEVILGKTGRIVIIDNEIVPRSPVYIKRMEDVVIDSTKCDPVALAAIEDALFGSEAEGAKLLLPDEIKAIVAGN